MQATRSLQLPDIAEEKHESSPPLPSSSASSQHTLCKLPWRLRVTDFPDILSAKHRGGGIQEDPFIVTWLDKDPENPQQYTTTFKCSIKFLIGFMTLCVSLASSAYTGVAKEIVLQFHISEEVFLLGLSLMLLSFALGPLL
jgi:hypothetical protein